MTIKGLAVFYLSRFSEKMFKKAFYTEGGAFANEVSAIKHFLLNFGKMYLKKRDISKIDFNFGNISLNLIDISKIKKKMVIGREQEQAIFKK